MPNAVEPPRQGVKQKASDEFVGGNGHDLLSVGARATVILVAEGDAGLIKDDKAAV